MCCRGEGTFFSVLVTFSLEFNSPQLGRMKNSDFLYLFQNNETYTPEGRLAAVVSSGWRLGAWLRCCSAKGCWSHW